MEVNTAGKKDCTCEWARNYKHNTSQEVPNYMLVTPATRSPGVIQVQSRSRVDNWPHHLRGFFQKEAMCVVEGNSILFSNRVVTPTLLRDEVLETLHRGHSGVKGMEERAKETLFWPGMN